MKSALLSGGTQGLCEIVRPAGSGAGPVAGELLQANEGFGSQCRGVARNVGLAYLFDAWHTPVQRSD